MTVIADVACRERKSEPGIHHGNEDSRGNENRKSWEKDIFRGKNSRQAYVFL